MALENSSLVSERSWFIAQRWQAYEAEARANLLRIIAIGAFYVVHLWSYFSAQVQLPQANFLQLAAPGEINEQFHTAVTLLAAVWTMLALGVLLVLQQRIFPHWLPYFSTTCDIALLTSVICLGSVARSPLVVGYFLILVLGTLRLSLPVIWFTTVGCAMAYLCVLGCAKWPDMFGMAVLVAGHTADFRVPRYHQVIVLLSIFLAGVMLGQIVRRVRRLAERFTTGHIGAKMDS
jgi:hypothetical protein